MNERKEVQCAIQRNLICAICCAAFSLAAPCVAQTTAEKLQQQEELVARQQQFEQQRQDFERQQLEIQKQQQEIERRRALLETQFARARRQYDQLAVQPTSATPEPERQIKIFPLKYLGANEASLTIAEVLGREAPRMSADVRSKSLVAAGTEKQLATVAEILKGLDTQAGDTRVREAATPPAETLQVRVIWVIEDPENYGAEEGDRFDSGVREALGKLGFGSPIIVCEPITSLIVRKGDSSPFAFEASVVLEGSVVPFQAEGTIEATDGDRYLVRVQLSVDPDSPGRGNTRNFKLKGAISTPLENYTVLGTGVAVSPPITTPAKPRNVSCAFIVQLQRATNISSVDDKRAASK